MSVIDILSDDTLREIEARTSAATDGPWQRGGNYWDINTVTADAGKYFIADCHKNPMSAEFIAHAREDIPALCATVRALRADYALVENYLAEIKRELGLPPNVVLGVTLENYKERVTAPLRAQLAQVTQERETCWHCGLVLEKQPKPRCEDCPDECDVVNCDALGCVDKLAQQHLDSWK